jgi:hypothetical protein
MARTSGLTKTDPIAAARAEADLQELPSRRGWQPLTLLPLFIVKLAKFTCLAYKQVKGVAQHASDHRKRVWCG